MALELLDDYTHELDKGELIFVPLTVGKRIASIGLEYLFCLMLTIFFIEPFNCSKDQEVFLIFLIVANKDIIGGKSLLKRLTNIKVININTGKAPNPIVSVLRIFTCILMIFEIFVLIISPQNRRIGDYLFKTIVVEDKNPKYKTSLKEDLKTTNWIMVLLALLISSVSIYILF